MLAFRTSSAYPNTAWCTPAARAGSPSTAAPTHRTATFGEREVNSSTVETTQITPTILPLLGLDPNALKAVQIERWRPLPLSD